MRNMKYNGDNKLGIPKFTAINQNYYYEVTFNG